jgi:hypothetical protein
VHVMVAPFGDLVILKFDLKIYHGRSIKVNFVDLWGGKETNSPSTASTLFKEVVPRKAVYLFSVSPG